MTIKELKNATLKNFFHKKTANVPEEETNSNPIQEINVLNKYMPARISKYPMIQQSK